MGMDEWLAAKHETDEFFRQERDKHFRRIMWTNVICAVAVLAFAGWLVSLVIGA